MNPAQVRLSVSHALSLDDVVFRLARHPQVDGILMMGSGAAAALSPTSDIDLLVVLAAEPLALFMVSTTIEQRLSEVYFMRAEELDAVIEQRLAVPEASFAAARLRWLRSGQILFDRARRLERARTALADGEWFIPSSEAEVYEAWYGVNYDLAQTRRLLRSSDPVALMKVDLRLLFMLDQLWQRYFLVRKRAGLSEKMQIRWMMSSDAPFLADFQACLAEPERARKFARYCGLAKVALEPVGGLWPEEMTAVQLQGGTDPALAEAQLDLWEAWLA